MGKLDKNNKYRAFSFTLYKVPHTEVAIFIPIIRCTKCTFQIVHNAGANRIS